MKTATKDLTGPALDHAVHIALGLGYRNDEKYGAMYFSRVCDPDTVRWGNCPYDYSTDWAQGGPIIERELLEVTPRFHSAGYKHPEGQWHWMAFVLGPNNIDENHGSTGPTPLIAAMRCYVASILGETVDIPEGLHG